jgi:branched-chain amino acid transport system substrate-binding protein
MSSVKLAGALALCALVYPGAASAQQTIPIGHLADFSGATSDVGVPYGQGVADAVKYINSKGGVNGKTISIETIDYSYQVPRAIAA